MKDKLVKTKVTAKKTKGAKKSKAKESSSVKKIDSPIVLPRIARKKSLLRNKTLIIGCGRLGASIANKISKEGRNVLVIDKYKQSFELLDDSFSGYQIVGDVIEISTLENAYISSAQEVIITTGDDNVNIYLALLTKRIFEVPYVYVRLDDPEMVQLLKDDDIEVILPFQLSYDKLDLMRGGK